MPAFSLIRESYRKKLEARPPSKQPISQYARLLRHPQEPECLKPALGSEGDPLRISLSQQDTGIDNTETECRIKVARRYLKKNLCRWTKDQNSNQSTVIIDGEEAALKQELENIQSLIDSNNEDHWLEAMGKLEELQGSDRVYRRCEELGVYHRYCLVYELYELLGYPLVQSKMKFTFQRVDKDILERAFPRAGLARLLEGDDTHPLVLAGDFEEVTKDEYYQSVKDWNPFTSGHGSEISGLWSTSMKPDSFQKKPFLAWSVGCP